MKHKIWATLFCMMFVGTVGAASGFQGLLPGDTQEQEAVVTGSKQALKCEYCGKVCVSPSALKIHIRSHTGERPYKCSVCSKLFTQTSALRDHKRIHTGEKPHKCKECNKSFARNSNLRMHERLHTGNKSYTCQVCGKSFAQSSNCKVHLRDVHGVKTSSVSAVKVKTEIEQVGLHEKKIHNPSSSSTIVANIDSQEWTIETLQELREDILTNPTLELTLLEAPTLENFLDKHTK